MVSLGQRAMSLMPAVNVSMGAPRRDGFEPLTDRMNDHLIGLVFHVLAPKKAGSSCQAHKQPIGTLAQQLKCSPKEKGLLSVAFN